MTEVITNHSQDRDAGLKTHTLPDGVKILIINDTARAALQRLTLHPDNAVSSTILAYQLFPRDLADGVFTEALARARVSSVVHNLNRRVLRDTNWVVMNTLPQHTQAAYYLAAKTVELRPVSFQPSLRIHSPLRVDITPSEEIARLGVDLGVRTKTADLQRKTPEQLKNLSLEEIHSMIQGTVADILQKYPDITPFHLNRMIAETLPGQTPIEVQTLAQKAWERNDPKAREVILYLNMKSIMSAVEPYLSDNEEENSEITQAALVAVLEELKEPPKIKIRISQHIFHIANRGAADYVAVRENMPTQSLALGNILLQELKDDYFDAKRSLSTRKIGRIADRLAGYIGLPRETLFDYLLFRHQLGNNSVQDESLMPGPSNTEDEVMQRLLREDLLREDMDAVLATIAVREQRVLKLRFGLEDGRERTLEEVGNELKITREGVRQIEAHALRQLRHPTRTKLLWPYLYT